MHLLFKCAIAIISRNIINNNNNNAIVIIITVLLCPRLNYSVDLAILSNGLVRLSTFTAARWILLVC